MKSLKKYVVLIITIPIAILLSACSESTTDTGNTKLQPVTNLKAFSVNHTSIGLKWTKSTSESLSDFDKYEVKVILNNNVVATYSILKGTDSTVITNLTAGAIYVFDVIAKATSSSKNYIDSDPQQIRWSPAWRFETEDGIPIKVYERTSSTGYPSGLIFYYQSLSAPPAPKTVSLLSSDSSQIDVFVNTRDASNVSLSSSHLYRPNRRITRFSTIEDASETLNNPKTVPPDTATYTKYEIQIDSVAVSSSKIVYFKGNNGNYGRILIMRNPSNGTLIWGSSPEQYLQLKISYQSQPYNPYSKTYRK